METRWQSHQRTEEWREDIVGPWMLRFYVIQPAPSQWVAVGLVATTQGYVFLTGCGQSASDALSELRHRLLQRFSSDVVRDQRVTLVGCAA
ncbi:hypothetical protein NET03_11430 [Thermomicrobium sp. CFH 73360]|uniref:hypothetical protein n=1 Tax=Thermomicrobium sp. CFH 73360 TaxID=2951987 RepID=UPI002076D96A|nr:hypothetical protein [Thermomicrobium sp. CFH 73360]MCM8747137.1 hypothetical protein [Thermomicrobium sp. CFH 73360]